MPNFIKLYFAIITGYELQILIRFEPTKYLEIVIH